MSNKPSEHITSENISQYARNLQGKKKTRGRKGKIASSSPTTIEIKSGRKTLKSNSLMTNSDEDDELDTEFFTTVGKSDYTTGRFKDAKALEIDQKFKQYV